MRVEAADMLWVGVAIFVAVLAVGAVVLRGRGRIVAWCAAFGCTIGVAIVPGHGELVLVPVVALLSTGDARALFGAAFAVAWMVVALRCVAAVGRARRHRGDGVR